MSIAARLRREKKLLKRYVGEANTCLAHYPQSFSWIEALKYYYEWRRYLEADGHALENKVPWITIGAIRFLDNWLRPSMRVFEFGSGGSTLFFARRVQSVYTVEHDMEWVKRVHEALTENGITNAEINLVESESIDDHNLRSPAEPSDYVSAAPGFEEQSFERYVSTIDEYSNASFDIVLVDGRARSSCLIHALPKIRLGGLVVFDNTDRSRYQLAIRRISDDFELFRDFPGPAPFLKGYTRTSIWRRTSRMKEKA